MKRLPRSSLLAATVLAAAGIAAVQAAVTPTPGCWATSFLDGAVHDQATPDLALQAQGDRVSSATDSDNRGRALLVALAQSVPGADAVNRNDTEAVFESRNDKGNLTGSFLVTKLETGWGVEAFRVRLPDEICR